MRQQSVATGWPILCRVKREAECIGLLLPVYRLSTTKTFVVPHRSYVGPDLAAAGPRMGFVGPLVGGKALAPCQLLFHPWVSNLWGPRSWLTNHLGEGH